MLLAFTSALAITLFAATPDAAKKPPSPFEFALSHPHPQAGDQIFYRLAWVNRGDKPVRVPRDMLDGLRATARYRSFSHYMNRPATSVHNVGRRAKAGKPKVQWVTLEPDEALERHGDLAEFFEACKKGCVSGGYELTVSLGGSAATAEEPDQVVDSDFEGTLAFELRPHRVPVKDAPGLAVAAKVKSVKDKKHGGKLVWQAQLTVTNKWRYPLWFPKPEFISVEYDQRDITEVSDIEGAFRKSHGGQGNWSTDKAWLLKPGKKKSFKVVLEDLEPDASADKSLVRIRLRPLSDFEPERELKAPHYFAGALKSGWIRIK